MTFDRPEDDPNRDLVAVFRTADASLLAVVKTVLDSVEIPYLVRGEGSLRLLPVGVFGIGMFKPVLGAEIMVPAERAEEARQLLELNVELDVDVEDDDPEGPSGRRGSSTP